MNARHVKILPGRKSDVLDAEWLAELLEHGLLRGNFVLPPAIRELWDLARYRKRLIQAHALECQRIQKTLEDERPGLMWLCDVQRHGPRFCPSGRAGVTEPRGVLRRIGELRPGFSSNEDVSRMATTPNDPTPRPGGAPHPGDPADGIDSAEPTTPATPAPSPPSPPPQWAFGSGPKAPSRSPRPRGKLIVRAAVAAGMALVAGVVAVVVANGNDGELTTGPADPTLDELEAALLTEADVGDGFLEVDLITPDEDSYDDWQMSKECRAAYGQFATLAGNESLVASFERSSDEADLSHGISLVEPGSPSLDELHDTIEQCGAIPVDNGDGDGDGDVQVELHPQPESVGGLGDDAMAIVWRIVVSSGPIEESIDGYEIMSVRGGVMSSVFAISGEDPQTSESEPVDRGFVRDLAELADQRVEDILTA